MRSRFSRFICANSTGPGILRQVVFSSPPVEIVRLLIVLVSSRRRDQLVSGEVGNTQKANDRRRFLGSLRLVNRSGTLKS